MPWPERWYPHLNRGLVAEYALVHDLVEVYAGDTPTLSIDAAGAVAKEHREQEAAQRLEDEFIGSLPWVPLMIAAYEARTTPEARFVRAVNKVLPKITHLLNGNATLTEQGITRAELEISWIEGQARALAGYASDFPEVLELCADLVASVAATYDGPEPRWIAVDDSAGHSEQLTKTRATRKNRRRLRFSDGLPEHWSAQVRRNYWGTWSAQGVYAGPGTPGPVVIVAGWCWSRASAIEQVRYWIEDTAADWAATPTTRASAPRGSE